MNKNPHLLIVIVAVATGGFVFFKFENKQVGHLDEFAECLADKGVAMYGADWCTHCQSEKRAFGDSFRFVPYVECPDDPKRCLVVGIDGFPTWIFPDGKKFEGEQGLEKLSRESGCQLPKSN